MRRKQFLAILTACMMLFGLAGCQGDIVVESVETEQIIEQTTIGAESTSENITAMLSEIEQETVLPPNMTMDDLLNMIQLNGKTLTLPTTLNDIMALGNEFSYKMARSEYYKTPEDSINNDGGVLYDIFYNEERICQIVIFADDYTGDVLASPIKRFSNGFGADIEKCGITFSLSNKLDMNSTVDEVIEVLGEPNNNSHSFIYSLSYAFYDEGIEYDILFAYSNQDFEIKSDEMLSIQIGIKY